MDIVQSLPVKMADQLHYAVTVVDTPCKAVVTSQATATLAAKVAPPRMCKQMRDLMRVNVTLPKLTQAPVTANTAKDAVINPAKIGTDSTGMETSYILPISHPVVVESALRDLAQLNQSQYSGEGQEGYVMACVERFCFWEQRPGHQWLTAVAVLVTCQCGHTDFMLNHATVSKVRLPFSCHRTFAGSETLGGEWCDSFGPPCCP